MASRTSAGALASRSAFARCSARSSATSAILPRARCKDAGMDSVFSVPTDSSGMRDKVAWVTGGASGLGRATAYALAEAGVEVVVADVQVEEGQAVAEDVGGHFVACDVRTLEANEAAVEFCVRECGGLDYAFL